MTLRETSLTLDSTHNRFLQSGHSTFPTRNRPVLILENNAFTIKKYKRELQRASFTDVTFATCITDISAFLDEYRFDLILLDCSVDEKPYKGLRYLDEIRSQGYDCSVAIVSGQPSIELYLQAAVLGADEFLVKGRYFNIVDEVTHLLQRSITLETDLNDIKPITCTGFFRTLGLSQNEIEVLSEYARGFPRYESLAERTGKSQTRLRKTFSRVFGKLERSVSIDNTAKLAHILTICSLYGLARFRTGRTTPPWFT